MTVKSNQTAVQLLAVVASLRIPYLLIHIYLLYTNYGGSIEYHLGNSKLRWNYSFSQSILIFFDFACDFVE